MTAASDWIANSSTLPDGAILYTSTQIDPYFSNYAATGWTKDATKYTRVQAWMNWYFAHVNTVDKWGLGGTIYNYDVAGTVESSTNDADSTDAYAATFLSLAWAYYRTGDTAAQQYVINAGEDRYDYIGKVILQTQQSDGLTWAKPDYQIKYLMDACETYRGLRDAANLFQSAFQDSVKATTYNHAADQMLQGINSMWLSGSSSWAVYKDAKGNLATPNYSNWYPDATSQMFPVLQGVVPASDTRSKTVYAKFNSAWPGWPKLQFNGANQRNEFPWVEMAAAAALMGDSSRVNAYISNVDRIYVSAGFPWPWYCLESGWFIRVNGYMLGGSM